MEIAIDKTFLWHYVAGPGPKVIGGWITKIRCGYPIWNIFFGSGTSKISGEGKGRLGTLTCINCRTLKGGISLGRLESLDVRTCSNYNPWNSNFAVKIPDSGERVETLGFQSYPVLMPLHVPHYQHYWFTIANYFANISNMPGWPKIIQASLIILVLLGIVIYMYMFELTVEFGNM